MPIADEEERKDFGMKFTTRLFVVAIALAIAGIWLPVAQAAQNKQPAAKGQTSARANQWRYTFHNSEWWYWLPEGRWVYWRDNRWNKFDPKAYVAPTSSSSELAAGFTTGSQIGATGGSRVANDFDVYPFYGRTLGELDRRVLQGNNEVGPFYGHALPNEVFGPWRAWRSSSPAYGHAIPDGN
jgi:hypothetical protein